MVRHANTRFEFSAILRAYMLEDREIELIRTPSLDRYSGGFSLRFTLDVWFDRLSCGSDIFEG